jgi:hypothetical protein
MNLCCIKTDVLVYTVDVCQLLHGRLLPGSRIAIHAAERILESRPV